MFPRLHVNDTDKGGPKAPPRNKMALYEQLSIPSERFKHNLISPAFTSQGNGNGRGLLFPPHLPSSRNSTELFHACRSDSDAPLAQFESINKAVGDDSRVNIFVKSNHSYSVSPNKGSKINTGQKKRPEKSLKQFVAIREQSTKTALSGSRSGRTDVDTVVIRGVEDRDSSVLTKDFQTGIVSSGENASGSLMVECVSEVGIIPDDIVQLIGKNHFWKARKSILHQQRVFALQVFELHKLIKVQKLIAGSPPHLLKASDCIAKSLKVPSAKRSPLKYIIKESQNVSNNKTDTERPNCNMEFSAENTIGKSSFSSVQNDSEPPSYIPFSGHQWLIPFMSPSEGLVYKPYPGPGFVGPLGGGCGPPWPTPTEGPQSSCNMPSQKNRGISVSNDIQASTASSPSEAAQGRFHHSPPRYPTHPTRVIRAVPRNARSASESAARIFRSIQEERKQCD